MTVVTEHLRATETAFEVLSHPSASSALQEALALAIDADTVVKAVVLDTSSGHALAVVPASLVVDVDLVRDVLGDEHAHVASEEEVARDFPEFELGAIPPLPALLHVPVVVDPSVLAQPHITFAAGTTRESVRTTPGAVFTEGSVAVAPIARRAAPDQGT